MSRWRLKIFFLFIFIVILTLGLSISFQSLLAAWSAPLANPPTCTAGDPGCDAPLNVSNTAQSKQGSLWINTSGTFDPGLWVTGKVGIGTAAPLSKLAVDVSSTAGDQGTVEFRLGQNDGTARDFIIRKDTSTPYGVNIIGAANTTVDAGFIAFSTSDQASGEKVRITSTGKVGIGTTGPGDKLVVQNNGALQVSVDNTGTGNTTFRLDRQTSSAESKILFQDGGATQWGVGAKASSNNFVIRDADSTERITIQKSGGNVGIGDTSPSRKLQVDGGSASSVAIYVDTDGSAGTDLELNTTDFRIQNRDNTPILFFTNNTEKARIAANGNVGIGTAAPGASLHIASSTAQTNIDNAAQLLQLDNAATDASGNLAGIRFRQTNGTNAGQGFIGLSSTGDVATRASMVFASPNTVGNAIERMRIDFSGNVGIGTTNPGALLAVGGNTTGLVAVFGGGTGKITVGTIDPVYTINGTKYATYLPGMTGQKEETSGVVSCQVKHGRCEYKIDFSTAKEGSDLWLFYKISSFKNNFGKLTVLLTPSFDGQAWYEKDAAANVLKIFAQPEDIADGWVEISYRLTAPRFDAAEWTNRAKDSDGHGFIIND